MHASQKLVIRNWHSCCYFLVDKWAKVEPNVYLCESLKTPNKWRTKISHRICDAEIQPCIISPRYGIVLEPVIERLRSFTEVGGALFKFLA